MFELFLIFIILVFVLLVLSLRSYTVIIQIPCKPSMKPTKIKEVVVDLKNKKKQKTSV